MKNILLVEDDPFISDIYSRSFSKENFKVDMAVDGQMALEKIRDNPPDLLVLDIDLPKINGCEILKKLRSEPKTKNLKVIVLSNYPDKDINKKYNINLDSFGIIKHFLKIEAPVDQIVREVKEILK